MFIPASETLTKASIQLGIILTDRYRTAADLNNWIMGEYRRAPLMRWYEKVTPDEACKIGVEPVRDAAAATEAMRPFVGVLVCRAARGYAACAEADELLPEADAIRCSANPAGCGEDLCIARFVARREMLESVVEGVLSK